MEQFILQQRNVIMHPATVRRMFGNFVKGCKRKETLITCIVLLQYSSPTPAAQSPSGVRKQEEVQRRCPWFLFTLIVIEDQVVVWDYHVILVYIGDDSTTVYDLDTTLPFPANFNEYCEATFGSDAQLKECYHRKLRVVPAQRYLATFASDRRHMRKPASEGGEWLQTPPPWPCIKTNAAIHNLDSFIDMTDGLGEGEVHDLGSFVWKLSRCRRENLESTD